MYKITIINIEMSFKLEVTNEDSFECTIRLINDGYRPVVLDFASGTNPGGGWRGKQTGTQEESLCRRSNLGLLLEKCRYPIPSDGLLYIKNVIINKDINGDTINPVKCSVIASELRAIASRKSQYLISRITNLYETAIKNKHDCIILGAWGLGAFRETDEDPELLASAMKHCALKYVSEIKTVFAIYKNKQNYKTFVRIME